MEVEEEDRAGLKKSLAEGLKREAFKPLDRTSEDDRVTGWVELHDPRATEFPSMSFLFGSELLVSYRVDSLRIPTAQVKSELEAWSRIFLEEKGRPPKKGEKNDQKALIIKKLRKTAFITTKTFDVSWNLDTGRLYIWASSRKLIEEMVEIFEASFAVRLVGRGPGPMAEANEEISVDDLRPTTELFGQEVNL